MHCLAALMMLRHTILNNFSCSSCYAVLQLLPFLLCLLPAVPQPIAPHNCGRTPISDVKEDEFMADLISFLSHRRGRYIDRSKFPDAGA
jgi:hypothetical protein